MVIGHQSHIRQLLHLPNVLGQWTGMVAWLISVWINPFLDDGLWPSGGLALAGMLSSSLLMTRTRSFNLWRLWALSFVFFEVWAYRLELDAMGDQAAVWILPIAAIISLGCTLLLARVLDFFIATVAVWGILFYGNLYLIESKDWHLFILVTFATVSLGILLNSTFLQILRHSLTLQERYRRQAETDALTGINNRRALMTALEVTCTRDQPQTGYFVMLDIDDFKGINDRYGHDVGDAVLIEIASQLGEHFGDGRYGRLGGEEFGILVTSLMQEDIVPRMQRLLDAVRASTRAGVSSSFSAGIARIGLNGTPSDVLRRADRELYQAKRAGKDRVYYQGSMVCG